MINDINNKKINLYIGLTTNTGVLLKKRDVLSLISREFIKVGVSGFNVNSIIGFWENTQEKAILISFFNTFGLSLDKLREIITKLKSDLKQDSILLEVLNTPFEFI